MPLLKLKTGTYLNYKLSRGGMEVVDVDPRKPVVVLSVLARSFATTQSFVLTLISPML